MKFHDLCLNFGLQKTVCFLSLAGFLFSSSATAGIQFDFPPDTLPSILSNTSNNAAKELLIRAHAESEDLLLVNPESNLHVVISENSTHLSTLNQEIHWQLSPIAYGYSGQLRNISPAKPTLQQPVVSLKHDSNLSQWFINSEVGLEHGFTLSNPPDKTGNNTSNIEIKLKLTSSLPVILEGDELRTAQDGVSIVYGNLLAFDSSGYTLTSTMALDKDIVTISVDDHGATYPIYIDPLFTREKRIHPNTELFGTHFGKSVSVSGALMVVGAPKYFSGVKNGAAFIFERNSGGNNNWGEQAVLSVADLQSTDLFGDSVAAYGVTVAVGAPGKDGKGAVYIFKEKITAEGEWELVETLNASDGASGDNFGEALALFEDILVVGASRHDDNGQDSGAAYIYYRDQSGQWSETIEVVPTDGATLDQFGASVSLYQDILVVGAPLATDTVSKSGTAYVFAKDQGGTDNWGQITKLAADFPQIDHRFGQSLSIFENDIIVGAPYDSNNTDDQGETYFFNRNYGGQDSWGMVDSFSAESADYADGYGHSVSIYGDFFAVAANRTLIDNLVQGSAHLYQRNPLDILEWSLYDELVSGAFSFFVKDKSDESLYGSSISLSGKTLAVGGHEDITGGQGSVYVYNTSIDLEINGETTTDVDEIGDLITFTFYIDNNDDELDATGVRFSFPIDPVFNLEEVVISQGSCTSDVEIICNIGTMLMGQTDVAITIKARIEDFGNYANTAKVEADQPDVDISNNSIEVGGKLEDKRLISRDTVSLLGCSLSVPGGFDPIFLLLILCSFLYISHNRKHK